MLVSNPTDSVSPSAIVDFNSELSTAASGVKENCERGIIRFDDLSERNRAAGATRNSIAGIRSRKSRVESSFSFYSRRLAAVKKATFSWSNFVARRLSNRDKSRG